MKKSRITVRESWLNAMARELKRLVFKPAGIDLNLTKVKLSVGYPPKGGASKHGKTIGVCFPRACSDANVNEIFINPCLDKTQVTRVAGVLVHELIHAVEDCKGHGPSFRKMALACGLTGRMTATTETAELGETIKKIEKKIGKYPHKKLDYEIGRKKQTTRNLKIECPKCADTDPYFVRMSKTMYEKGAPSCGVCGTEMTHDIIGSTIKDIQVTSADNHLHDKEKIQLFNEIKTARQNLISKGVKYSQLYNRLQDEGYFIQTLNWFIYYNRHKYLRDAWEGGDK